MTDDGRTEGSPGATPTGVVKLEEQVQPPVPFTPHPLNPHNTTCMSCFSSKVRCDRQVPCARCARLNLLCKPNPRKPGRPSRQLKPPSAPQPQFPSSSSAAQFAYHVPPANTTPCYCLPQGAVLNHAPTTPTLAPNSGRPAEAKLYTLQPLIPFPLTGLPIPHPPVSATGAPHFNHHYHRLQLAPQQPSVSSPSGPSPVAGVGDEEWTEVCQLLSDPHSPTGRDAAVANACQVLDRATTAMNGGSSSGSSVASCSSTDSAQSTTGTAPASYHHQYHHHHHQLSPECFTLPPQCWSPTAPGGGLVATQANNGGDGGLATDKGSVRNPTSTTTGSPCSLPRSGSALIQHSKLSLKCTIRQSVVQNGGSSSPPLAAQLLPRPPQPHEAFLPSSLTAAVHSPQAVAVPSKSRHVLHHHHHHHHPPLPAPAPAPLPAPSYSAYQPMPAPLPSADDEEGPLVMSSFEIVSRVVGKVATGAISYAKATAVLSSWHCWNLLLGQDTTAGLLTPLARTFRLELPRVLAPVTTDLAEAEYAERSMLNCLAPLWALTDPSVAVCSVRWCRGQVRVMCSERFDAVFMHKTVLEEGIMANAKLPHLLWASLVVGSSQRDYWDAWAEACFEDHSGATGTDGDSKAPAGKQRLDMGASRTLLVRDRFKVEDHVRATLGMYASPCGWYSCTWLVLM